MIKELQTLSFLRTFENIIFIGGTGVGKSFLAQAIGHASCLSGNETRFIPVNYLFEQFKAAEKAGQVLLFLKKLSQAEILILDDFGLRKYITKKQPYFISSLRIATKKDLQLLRVR